MSYRVLADSLPQQVWTARPDGALDYVNPVVLTYFAQTSEAILGAGWQTVIHPDDLAGCVERWTTSLSTGVDYEIEFRLRRHDGQYRWHIGRASAERDSAGKIIRWLGTNTDIDEQRQAIRTRDELLATVSHDLRNPLGTIALATVNLRRTHGEHRALDSIERAVRRMERLIQDLLDMASIESGHLSITQTDCTVDGLVAELTEEIQPLAARKAVTLEMDVPAIPLPLRCDRGRVMQVFLNILGNAVKFTPKEGRISLRARLRADRFVSFAISDTGPGIEPAQLPFVFDRFWQAKETARAGTGLGLAICQGIIQQHGGVLWVESQLGVGTTFSFTLPTGSPAIVRGDAIAGAGEVI